MSGRLEDKFFAFCFYSIPPMSIRREMGFRSIRYADVLVCEGQELPFLKPIQDELRGRTVIIEQYGRQPDAATRGDILELSLKIKREYRREQRRKRKEELSKPTTTRKAILAGKRKPLFVVISPRPPRQLAQFGMVRPHERIAGVWCGLGPLAELLYISVRDLEPSDRRWDQLGWGFAASDSPDVDRTRFFDDGNIAIETRLALREMIMENKSYATDSEYQSVSDRLVAKGIREGKQAGLREGKQTGLREGKRQGQHEMLKRFAQSVLSSEDLAELDAIADLDERFDALLRKLRD